MFVCFVVSFCLNHPGIPTGRFPESFVKIGLDLTEIKKTTVCLFLCLFVFLYVFFFFNQLKIPTGYFLESFVMFRLDIAEI